MADKKEKGAAKPKQLGKGKKDFYAAGKEGKLERKKRNCPKCGPGVFLAEPLVPVCLVTQLSCGAPSREPARLKPNRWAD